MKSKIFAIGDIHGNCDGLIALFDKLILEAGMDLRRDVLVITGDLVDSGNAVNELVTWCILTEKKWGKDHFVCLMGNHEDLMLDALGDQKVYGDYYLWWQQGGRETLTSYTEKFNVTDYEKAIMQPLDYIPKEHIEWLEGLRYYYETKDYFFVHGGVPPRVPLKDLKKDDPKVQYEMLWIRDAFIQSNYNWGKKIIFGHTPKVNQKTKMFEPWVMRNKIGINTQPRFNFGYLCAIELPIERFWKV